MILRSALRRQNLLLRAASPRFAKINPSDLFFQVRLAHGVPSIGEFDAQFVRDGVPQLYSPDAYGLAWTQYQKYLVDRLNTISASNPSIPENADVKAILLMTAREPSMAAAFNYASMAHNNHFFFQCLSPATTAMPEELEKSLTTSFSSIDSLRQTFLTTAAAMFGPGFVWLVQHHNPSPNKPSVKAAAISASGHAYSPRGPGDGLHFSILTTYLAGSPYPGAHARQQGRDMNTQNLVSSEDWYRQTYVQNTPGVFGRARGGQGALGPLGASDAVQRQYGGAEITPVLCVNTWEHAWMFDWNVDGKRLFLERWWDRINWEQVWRHCYLGDPNRPQFFSR